MKAKSILQPAVCGLLAIFLCQCDNPPAPAQEAAGEPAEAGPGQSAVADDMSQKDIVKIAVASPDHTTLVTAVKAAGLVDTLTNAGPFTVFAPTNAAFARRGAADACCTSADRHR